MRISTAVAKAGCWGCIYHEDPKAWQPDPHDGWIKCIHEKECAPDPDNESDYDKIFIALDDGNSY